MAKSKFIVAFIILGAASGLASGIYILLFHGDYREPAELPEQESVRRQSNTRINNDELYSGTDPKHEGNTSESNTNEPNPELPKPLKEIPEPEYNIDEGLKSISKMLESAPYFPYPSANPDRLDSQAKERTISYMKRVLLEIGKIEDGILRECVFEVLSSEREIIHYQDLVTKTKGQNDPNRVSYLGKISEASSSIPHKIIKILQGEKRWAFIRARGWEQYYRSHPERLR